jgi:long-subunit fatty acid transport protein
LALKPKLRAEADYPYGNFVLRASAETVDGFWFPQVGLNYQVAEKWQLGLDYETRFGAAQISLHHPKYFLALSSQNLNLNASRALGVAMGLNYTF